MNETGTMLRVLMVEDNATDAAVIETTLDVEAEDGYIFDIVAEVTMVGALDRLRVEEFDVAFLDLLLPDADGLEVVDQVQAADSTLPLVVLTSTDDMVLAREAVRTGAQDYLVKGPLSRDVLLRTIMYAIERKGMELRQLRAKDRVISQVSHELWTPLSVIMHVHDLLQRPRTGPLTAEQVRLLEAARRNTTLLAAMTNDLVTVVAIDENNLSLRRERISLGGVVDDVHDELALLAADKSLGLSCHVPGDLPDVWADVDRVRQILINLVTNSFRFTPERGSVTIDARGPDELQGDGFVEVRVTDEGVGIGRQDVGRVFDRHYQAADWSSGPSRQGLGLGLHISRELVLRHGGEIWVESPSGSGTTVSFTLPVA